MPITIRRLVKVFWRTCALLIVGLAVVVQLGRELSPLLAEHRVWLEERLSQSLGASVTMSNINAEWIGLLPRLRVADLRITPLDPFEVQPLYIKDGYIELDLSETLWQRQFIWKTLSLKGVQLSLLQNAQGTWGLPGLPVRESSSRLWLTDLDPLSMLLNSGRAELLDNAITLQFSDGRESYLRLPEILLENDGTDFHRISAAVTVDGAEQSLNFVAEGVGDPRRRSFVGQGYLNLQAFPLGRFLQALPHASDEASFVLEKDAQAQLDLSVWLDWRKNKQVDLFGELALQTNHAQLETGVVLPAQLNSVFSGNWQSINKWQADINQLSAQWGAGVIEGFAARISRSAQQMNVFVPTVALEPWTQGLLGSALLQGDAGSRVSEVLATLAATGQLRNVHLAVPLQNWRDLQLKAQADHLAVNSWRGAPALSGVSGYLESGLMQGSIALASEDGFSMFYPTVYAAPMAYDTALGTVGWNLQPDNNAVYVHSSLVNFTGEDGSVSGVFKLFLPWVRDTEPSDLVLQIGLVNSQARYHKKYVPQLVPDSLLTWLDESIVGGTIRKAGFVYRGRLKGTPEERAIQVFVDLDKGQLKFQPDWPAVEGIEGQLVVNNGEVSTQVNGAKIYHTDIGEGLVTVKPNPLGEGNVLGINAVIKGPAADGFKILRDNVLNLGRSGERSTAMQQWDLQGQLTGQLALQIPLSSGQPGHRQQVDIELAEATLALQDINLQFEHLSGALSYGNENGLQATALEAQLWGVPVNASIASKPLVSDGALTRHDINVAATGMIPVQRLAQWSQRPEVLFLKGDIPTKANVLIAADRAASGYDVKINIDSDLQGVAVNLPGELAKPAAGKGSFKMSIPVTDGSLRYQFSYGDHLKGVLEQQQGALTNAVVALNAPAQLAVDPQFLITGQLAQVDLLEWQEILENYEHYSNQLAAQRSATVDRDNTSTLTQAVDLRFETARFKDLQLDNLNVSGQLRDDAWYLQLQNTLLAGDLVWQKGAPLLVDLDYLRLPAPEPSVAEASGTEPGDERVAPADALVDVDLSALVDVNFATQEFMLGDEAYGQWAFKLRNQSAEKDRAQIDIVDIHAVVRGTTITGLPDSVAAKEQSGEKPAGASFRWSQDEDGMHSAFQGRLIADGMQKVLAAWHQPELLKSEKAVFDADWYWQGSPAAINLLGLQGGLKVDVQRGVFVKGADVGANPLLRLMGLFNFDTWARRLKLDFSDLYSEGMAFDNIQGELLFDKGVVKLAQPVVAKTPSSRLQLGGVINLENETLDTHLVATLPVGGNLTLISALAGGLPMAAGVYVASKLFEKQVDKVASVSYSLSGDWNDPTVRFEKLFDKDAAKEAGLKSDVTAEELRTDPPSSAKTPAAPADAGQGTAAPAP